MANRSLLVLIAIIFIPIGSANAFTGDVELTLEDVKITPSEPEMGDIITITGEVYNLGKTNTGAIVSIITMGFFVDDKLVDIKDVGDIKTGIGNKKVITSESIWKVEAGKHTVKVVLDYHNTLSNQLDLPEDNTVEKTFFVSSFNPTELLLEVEPQYGIEGKENILNITASLTDANTNLPLEDKKIIFDFEGEKIELATNEKGEILFPYINNFFKTHDVKAFFEGDSYYDSTDSSSTMHSIPEEITSALIITVSDEKNQHNFVDNLFEIIIFQDSYQNIAERIKSNSTRLLDSETLLIPLAPGHDYFGEAYLNGEFFSVITKEQLKENSLIIKEITIPESALVKFKVIDDNDSPILKGIVRSGPYLESIENGFTDWIEIISTTQKPHITEITLPNQTSIKSNSFLVFPGERKVVTLTVKEISPSEIPNWVRNNAGWWSEESIDDETFIEGIQFMVKNGIIKVPVTAQNAQTSLEKIPNWVRNNAGWWSEESIDDETFIEGIQFMVKNGIIKVPVTAQNAQTSLEDQ